MDLLLKIIKKAYSFFINYEIKKARAKQLLVNKSYFQNGQIPWSDGYNYYKKESIINSITNSNLLKEFIHNRVPENYGFRLDERIVEYPWIFSKLSKSNCKMLDAGSTFNFEYLIEHPNISDKDLTIYTFAPEGTSFCENRISYVYGDLRDLPFKNEYFDVVVSQSTLEHIDMDNSMYGYKLEYNMNEEKKSYEYLKVIDEMLRVLKPNGNLLVTFPYGKFENHGFFQQFDTEMLSMVEKRLNNFGAFELTFFKYLETGWIASNQSDCNQSESFNPHTGRGAKSDFAAHSRAICCIHFKKD